MRKHTIVPIDRARAVRAYAQDAAVTAGLDQQKTREVGQYAIKALADGHSAHRALQLAAQYAEVLAYGLSWSDFPPRPDGAA